MPKNDNTFSDLDRKVENLRLKRSEDAQDEARKTLDEVFDRQTMFAIDKLMKMGVLESIDFPISTGKEGNVFRVTTPENEILAMKVYRTSNSTFHNIAKYIEGDPRFKGLQGSHRKIIFAWAAKEFKNLCRMTEAKVRVPEPVKFHKNILFMEYIGTEEQPAPSLKNSRLENPDEIYEKILKYMKLMYRKAELVHGDLSEYNILLENGEPVIIDVGQAMLVDHVNSLEFLNRDIGNINHYFRSLDIKTKTDAEVLKFIQGAKKK
jgi:RIO kinase 1